MGAYDARHRQNPQFMVAFPLRRILSMSKHTEILSFASQRELDSAECDSVEFSGFQNAFMSHSHYDRFPILTSNSTKIRSHIKSLICNTKPPTDSIENGNFHQSKKRETEIISVISPHIRSAAYANAIHILVGYQ